MLIWVVYKNNVRENIYHISQHRHNQLIINTIKAGRYLSFEDIFQPFFQVQRRIYQPTLLAATFFCDHHVIILSTMSCCSLAVLRRYMRVVSILSCPIKSANREISLNLSKKFLAYL